MADTEKKYTSNTYNTKNSRNVYGTVATYWYFNDSSTLTNEERSYGQVIEEEGNKLLKLDANGADMNAGIFARLNYQYSGLSPSRVYSYSTKIKFTENAYVNFTAKIGGVNGGKFIFPSFLRFEGGKLYAGNALIGNCRSDVWYEVECVIDYGKSRIALFVNGIKYLDTPINANNGDRSIFSPIIDVGSLIGKNSTDIVYFDDMAVKEIYDMNVCTISENKTYLLSLEEADDGTYNAFCNEQNILPAYAYAAVFREHLADDESNTVVSSELVGVYEVKDIEADNIKIPVAEYYASGKPKSKATVRLMAWDSQMKPIKTLVEGIE